MDDQAIEPGLESVRITESRQVAPRSEERPLRGVLCPMDVTQDPVGEGVTAIDVRGGERGEGVFVTSTRPLYEIGLHLGPIPGWPSDRLTEYGAAASGNVQCAPRARGAI